MTRFGDVSAEVAAATNPPCAECWSMSTWLPAGGPDEVAVRVKLMLALVDLGRAEVLVARPAPSWPHYRPWTEIDPELITPALVQNGQAENLTVDSSLEIQCRACRRRYTQSWVPERGYERWTVVADRSAVPGPPAT